MATATVARTSNALRQRRDIQRPTLPKRQTNMDGPSERPAKKAKLEEPYVITGEHILKKFYDKEPSLTLHLHQNNFKFEGQDGSFAYDSEMKFVLQHLRNKTVPHEMIQELLETNVRFYDGRLIVEVHDHKSRPSKDKSRNDSTQDEDTVKFSMHNYNEHVTPSPMAPFPSKARTVEASEKTESNGSEMPAPEKPKEKDDGPRIFTVVLHPTQLSMHHEMMILANTPASDVRNKKRSSDSTTPSSAHPPTPGVSVPPTPIAQSARTASTQSQKMYLEAEDKYEIEAEMLLATQPPLYLDPVDNPQDAQNVLDFLQDPLHQAKPPSPKTRKRTTAELAADDAQQQETVRRMLIMDERLKPAGAGVATNENQGASTSLTFSRFKTIDMVRQKLEDSERQKKEEEYRVSAEKKVAEEQRNTEQQAVNQRQRQMQIMAQAQQQQQQQQQQPNQQALMMQQQRQQQQHQQQQQQQMRAMAQAQQQAQMQIQNHAHPQQNGMMQNQQQNFQHGNQVSMAQSSPIVRQQTPLINSSPMMAQNGFPNASTGANAGSPPRPTSAMQHPMARQVSQQRQGSHNNTPQMAQSTPNLGQAVPNRQMTQTPRMPPGSPAAGMQHGTPTPASMPMQTPHMGNQNQFTPEQIAMINQQRALNTQSQQGASMQAGSPQQNMMPEQFQNIQNMHRQNQLQRNAMMQAQGQGLTQAQIAAQAGNHPQLAQMREARQRQMLLQRQQQIQQQQQQQQGGQMHGTPGQAGSPGAMQQPTPQMGHAHPQQGNMSDPNQMTQQQQQHVANAHARAQQLAQMKAGVQQQQHHAVQQQATAQARQMIAPLLQQYGGLQGIPQHILQGLPQNVQQVLRQSISQNQARQQQAMRAQQQQQQNQGGGGGGGGGGAGGGEQVPGGQPNPHYMQQLRNNASMMQAQMQQQQQQQQQQQGGGGMNGMAGMNFPMNGAGAGGGGGGQQNFAGNRQTSSDPLSVEFAAMQNALTRSNGNGNQQGGGGGQGQGQGMQ